MTALEKWTRWEADSAHIRSDSITISVAHDAIESLKRCGNCAHLFLAGWEQDESCDVWRYEDKEPKYGYVRHSDKCHYAPPQWEELA